MTKSRRLLTVLMSLMMIVAISTQASMTVCAGDNDYLQYLRGGVASVLTPATSDSTDVVSAKARELNIELTGSTVEKEEESRLVMANVQNALNVRSDASETASRVGMLYKGCGGIVIERRDGWTKLQSGNIIGWASDTYLLFGEEAEALANDVGKTIATINTETLRVRMAPDSEAGVLGLLPKGEIVEVLNQDTEGWICVDYDGADGYISAEYATVDFIIAAGETVEEIKAREAAELEAKRYVNYGEFTVDEETMLLLAAIIHCEARGESYEGQVAVGAVVMNRVRSKAFPDTIRGVVYAPGQFTPAMTGKLDQVVASGDINESCIKAAKEALSGYSNVADRLFFRRNNGREGLVIGNHVFY